MAKEQNHGIHHEMQLGNLQYKNALQQTNVSLLPSNLTTVSNLYCHCCCSNVFLFV